ncbi:unnamed protein product [Didymodactylos carnosus]|uniref:Uncharacterized protein n=1 Tax=Didymodactylos carnosus TaxID=1234261 RepID=A0A8S2EJ83_9BILA|nr:unnamed protein product [Didymodactylos carnosus]CAF4031473.1 unnamed protein product [Didymodactylos carnosus]
MILVTPKRDRGSFDEEEVDENEESIPGTVYESKNKFPLVYVLPKMDPSFEEVIADPSLRNCGPRCSRRIQLMKVIHDDVINTYGTDFYPSAVQFERMVKAVLDKWPVLREIFGHDMVS